MTAEETQTPEYNNVKQAREIIQNQFNDLLDKTLGKFEKIFTPFEF